MLTEDQLEQHLTILLVYKFDSLENKIVNATV